VIVKRGKIIFKKCPVGYSQFAILKIESRKKKKFWRARSKGAPFVLVELVKEASWARILCEKKFENPSVGAMIRKKAKKPGKRAAANKSAKKRVSKNGKQLDPAKVRDEVAGIVKLQAKAIAHGVVDKASHGGLAQAKYLFELAKIFPSEGAEPTTQAATENEDALAKMLLDRLQPPAIPNTENDDSDREQDDTDEDLDLLRAKSALGAANEEKNEIVLASAGSSGSTRTCIP
jgi:hypothetical protein